MSPANSGLDTVPPGPAQWGTLPEYRTNWTERVGGGDGIPEHINGRFYTGGRIIRLDELGQTFVVRLVIRL